METDKALTCESCKHLRLRTRKDDRRHHTGGWDHARLWCNKLDEPTVLSALRCGGDDHEPRPLGIFKTLKEVLPREFMTSEFESSLARKYADEIVLCKHDAREEPWPDVLYKNVTYWWELANGYAVGFNENPARGWSFPICRIQD